MKQTRSAILYDDNRSIDMRYCWLLLSLFRVLNANDELNIVINRNLINCQCLDCCCKLLLLLLLAGWWCCRDAVRYLHFIYLCNSFCIWKRYSLFAASFLIISFDGSASWKRSDVHGASESMRKMRWHQEGNVFLFRYYLSVVPPRFVLGNAYVAHLHLPFCASRANTGLSICITSSNSTNWKRWYVFTKRW